MKWETLKHQVACEVRQSIIKCWGIYPFEILCDIVSCNFETLKGKVSEEVLTSYADKAYERIMEWDIRCVGKLRELFPSNFPHSLRKGALKIDQNEKGDWIVYIN